jgi:hypothetical protein
VARLVTSLLLTLLGVQPAPVTGRITMFQSFALLLVAALLVLSPMTTAAQNVAGEEAAIKSVIETSIRSFNKDDLTTMLAQFADDAIIDSRAAGGKVPKAKYAEVMAEVVKKGDVISSEVRDMSITMTDPTHATVLGTVYLQTRTSRPSGRNEWKLEKRDGRWLIVETNRK